MPQVEESKQPAPLFEVKNFFNDGQKNQDVSPTKSEAVSSKEAPVVEKFNLTGMSMLTDMPPIETEDKPTGAGMSIALGDTPKIEKPVLTVEEHDRKM